MKPKPKKAATKSTKAAKPAPVKAVAKDKQKSVSKSIAKKTTNKDKSVTVKSNEDSKKNKVTSKTELKENKVKELPNKSVAAAKPDASKAKAESGKKASGKPEGEGKKRGRKKKGDDDDEEAQVVIENIEIIPEPALIPKKVSQKDKAKDRILAKLREKQASELHKRNFLPSKKKKYTLEYIIKSSPIILWDFVTTSSGLALWFADEVDDHLDIFTFTWEGNKQQAEVVEYEDLEFIRFRWVDNPYDEYFEFRITSTEITGDTVLLITDFAEQYELRDVQLLWDSQIKALMMRLGLGN